MPANTIPELGRREPSVRRRAAMGAVATSVIIAAPLASHADVAAGWEATRQAKLQAMAEKDKAQAALCAGRTASEIPDLSYWDMTFDPPCYISGYYEVIAAVIILASLKVRQSLD